MKQEILKLKPFEAALLASLVSKTDKEGIITVSREELTKELDSNIETIRLTLKILQDLEMIYVNKNGKYNVYTLNEDYRNITTRFNYSFILDKYERGLGVLLAYVDTNKSTLQLSKELNVSRPTLIRLLKSLRKKGYYECN